MNTLPGSEIYIDEKVVKKRDGIGRLTADKYSARSTVKWSSRMYGMILRQKV